MVRRKKQVAMTGSCMALVFGWAAVALAQDAPAVATQPAPAVAASPPVSTTPSPSEILQSAPRAIPVSGCFVPPARLADADIDAFLARPDAIFADYGSSNLSLANRVRALAGSDERTLAPLLGLANAANPQQIAAVGSGLGRAAVVCERVDPEYAQLIQKGVVDQASPELQASFVTASNDVQVAAIQGGGGGGAAAAGLSGGGLAGPGTAGLGGDEVVPTTVESYSFSGSSIILDDSDDDSNSGGNGGDVSPSEMM